jgi:hypothetical protein
LTAPDQKLERDLITISLKFLRLILSTDLAAPGVTVQDVIAGLAQNRQPSPPCTIAGSGVSTIRPDSGFVPGASAPANRATTLWVTMSLASHRLMCLVASQTRCDQVNNVDQTMPWQSDSVVGNPFTQHNFAKRNIDLTGQSTAIPGQMRLGCHE